MQRTLVALVVALGMIPAAVSAQTAARRTTNLASLAAYPGFFHGRAVLIVGNVTTTEAGSRVADDNASIRVLSKGPTPDGLDEIRGEFWDLGRMKPDDPQLSSYDLKRTFNIDATGSWPRPGEITAIIATAVTQAQPPPAASVRSIALYPARFVDQKVTVSGQFGGRNLFGDLPDAPGKSRYDFVIRTADAAIWVSGAQPKGKGFNLSLDARLDTGRWLEITGTVRTGRGLEWLEVGENGIQLGKAPTEAAPVDTEQIRVSAAPPPEVIFSTPTQDETDVSMSTTVRIQFSRDIDPSTIRGNLRARYLEAQTAERGEPTTPTAEFATQYTPPTRTLEIKFTKPLERFRTLRVELGAGILGTDKQPLKPWTLSFDLGGRSNLSEMA